MPVFNTGIFVLIQFKMINIPINDSFIEAINSTILIRRDSRIEYCLKFNNNNSSTILTVKRHSAFATKNVASRRLTEFLIDVLSGAEERNAENHVDPQKGHRCDFSEAVNINHYIDELTSYSRGRINTYAEKTKIVSSIKKELLARGIFTIEPIK